MVAQGFIKITHVPSECKLADNLSKHYSHQASYNNLIKLLLHFHSDGDEYFTVNSIDLSHLSHDGIVALLICKSCNLQFLSAVYFILDD